MQSPKRLNASDVIFLPFFRAFLVLMAAKFTHEPPRWRIRTIKTRRTSRSFDCEGKVRNGALNHNADATCWNPNGGIHIVDSHNLAVHM